MPRKKMVIEVMGTSPNGHPNGGAWLTKGNLLVFVGKHVLEDALEALNKGKPYKQEIG